MKKILLNIYRGIVGNEYGWSGEGNEQWYYSLALVINLMLTWWQKPELGVIFTVGSIIHYITVCIYGPAIYPDSSIWYPISYYAIHSVIFMVCIFFNWKWTLITSLIVVIAFLMAPDCMGDNIFMCLLDDTILYYGNKKNASILVFHTILFVFFVFITLSLPISLWIRIMIIVICMILHPIIDFFAGECIHIGDLTNDFWGIILQAINDHKDSKNY